MVPLEPKIPLIQMILLDSISPLYPRDQYLEPIVAMESFKRMIRLVIINSAYTMTLLTSTKMESFNSSILLLGVPLVPIEAFYRKFLKRTQLW